MSRASSSSRKSSNSTLIASEWPTNTGTRTQVAVTFTLVSRIFLVSATIFHSSLVSPESRNTSICGITLKAICFWNFLGATSCPGTYIPLVWDHSSSMPSLPAPLTDW